MIISKTTGIKSWKFVALFVIVDTSVLDTPKHAAVLGVCPSIGGEEDGWTGVAVRRHLFLLTTEAGDLKGDEGVSSMADMWTQHLSTTSLCANIL